ncbi:arylamine N-acetyltransferase [Schinkia azotoformans]|uniref:arylamine N-acetyltransferase family protein n=1 Tax=Schinkia azotoformans TaxID=1454 RepID=UPI002E205FEA|nr:arylamine N-acetyltransferase [Schinkia azotoformans]MED4351976.1 arylamine N-acetyltransferase [Schinkia azotoformans]
MPDINALFRKRIGLPEDEIVRFEILDKVLEKTAKSIPFENICIINKNTSDISKESLVNKILDRNEGGVCYELNPILYLFLQENGFDVSLVRGAVYDHSAQNWAPTGLTHVTILLNLNNQTFVLDTGFGGNLPLKPVPLNGRMVHSGNGQFRIKKQNSEYGDYVFEMKLKHKDSDWKLGYAFDTKSIIRDLPELNAIKQVISESEHSAFNKAPLMTKITDSGTVTLTGSSLTVWTDGEMKKEDIAETQYPDLAKKHFGLSVK